MKKDKGRDGQEERDNGEEVVVKGRRGGKGRGVEREREAMSGCERVL